MDDMWKPFGLKQVNHPMFSGSDPKNPKEAAHVAHSFGHASFVHAIWKDFEESKCVGEIKRKTDRELEKDAEVEERKMEREQAKMDKLAEKKRKQDEKKEARKGKKTTVRKDAKVKAEDTAYRG
jgi:hypothetical protein